MRLLLMTRMISKISGYLTFVGLNKLDCCVFKYLRLDEVLMDEVARRVWLHIAKTTLLLEQFGANNQNFKLFSTTIKQTRFKYYNLFN